MVMEMGLVSLGLISLWLDMVDGLSEFGIRHDLKPLILSDSGLSMTCWSSLPAFRVLGGDAWCLYRLRCLRAGYFRVDGLERRISAEVWYQM